MGLMSLLRKKPMKVLGLGLVGLVGLGLISSCGSDYPSWDEVSSLARDARISDTTITADLLQYYAKNDGKWEPCSLEISIPLYYIPITSEDFYSYLQHHVNATLPNTDYFHNFLENYPLQDFINKNYSSDVTHTTEPINLHLKFGPDGGYEIRNKWFGDHPVDLSDTLNINSDYFTDSSGTYMTE